MSASAIHALAEAAQSYSFQAFSGHSIAWLQHVVFEVALGDLAEPLCATRKLTLHASGSNC